MLPLAVWVAWAEWVAWISNPTIYLLILRRGAQPRLPFLHIFLLNKAKNFLISVDMNIQIIHVTPLYVGILTLLWILTLLFVAFSVVVIRRRLKCKQVIGDGGHDIMLRHARAQHANFVEYVPLILLLMLCLELGGVNAIILHIMGIALIAGRILHFYILTNKEPKNAAQGKMYMVFRPIGMMLTFGCLFIGAIIAIINYF